MPIHTPVAPDDLNHQPCGSDRLHWMKSASPSVPWSVDRWGRLLAGSGILVATTLGMVHHPAWLIFALLSSANLVFTSITDHCVLRNMLIRCGVREREDLFLPGGVPRTNLTANSTHETDPRSIQPPGK